MDSKILASFLWHVCFFDTVMGHGLPLNEFGPAIKPLIAEQMCFKLVSDCMDVDPWIGLPLFSMFENIMFHVSQSRNECFIMKS